MLHIDSKTITNEVICRHLMSVSKLGDVICCRVYVLLNLLMLK